MTGVPSSTTWGSPTATKHALLLHGVTSSSHTWHRVASSLAVQGYFVTAPNLVGHGSRVSTGDYRLSTVANDLRPYLGARHHSLIIGHSLGAVTAVHLFPHLPPSHPTAILLVDPPMERAPEQLDLVDGIFSDACTNIKLAEAYAAENPLWTREDSIYRELGTRLCSVDAIHGILSQNRPWNFFDRFDDIPDKCKVTVMVADPAIHRLCLVNKLDLYPRVRSVVAPGAGHWIQYEFPEAIVDEALKTVAVLDASGV